MAIYTRISSDRNNDEVGVTRQENLCREYAASRGLTVVAVETDNDTSAFKARSRNGWNSLLRRIERGEISGVVVWHTDRLYRRIADLAVLMKLVKDSKVGIYSVVAGDIDLSTASGILMAEILATVAGYEVRHKSERQVAKAREIAHAGLWGGGRTPLGYRKHPTEKHMIVVNQEEAEILRAARHRLLAGHGIKATTLWVREQVLRDNEHRKTLTTTSFRKTLLSPTIAGKRVYVPQSERDLWDERRAAGTQRPDDFTYRPDHILPAKWEPIFTDAEWKSIVAFLTQPGRRNPGRAPKALLSGILFCQKCDSVMAISSVRGQNPSYKCSDNTLSCSGIGVSAAPIEKYVIGIAQALIEGSARFTVGLPRIRSLPDLSKRDALVAKEESWLDLFDQGTISRKQLEERLDSVRSELRALNENEAEHLSQLEQHRELNDSLKRWEGLDIPERRAVLKALLVKVTILPTSRIWGRKFQPLRVVPWWNGGAEPDIADYQRQLKEAELLQRHKLDNPPAKGEPGRPSKKHANRLK